MKPFLITSGVVLAMSLLAFVLLMPASGNFVRYLWWRAMSAAIVVRGSVRSGDADIHYVKYGSGLPLLLLHGGLSHRLSWFSQLPWLAASGREVIVVDTRGHGESGLGDTELSYRLLASDVVHVLNQLGIQHTDVIGWSDGANTALLLARYWPERVCRIVAISGNSDPSGLTSEARADSSTHSTGLTYWWYRWWTRAGERIDELERRIKHLWRNNPSLQAHDLGAIEAPTLLIVGEHDVITSEHAQQMADLLPHGTLEVIPAGGHATLITHACQIDMLIGKFLGIPIDYLCKK
ncbi:MAG: alpha/beta fold hydrolase [Desulfocapsaceae bacterium]|nr:alpha/beta fold hydrolase [Desulfocapsaceae bacterium]